MSRGTKIAITVIILVVVIIGVILIVRSATQSTTPEPSVSPTATPIGDDQDGDELSDTDEAKFGTDATNPDTDGDGYNDGAEVKYGFHPGIKAPYDHFMPHTQSVGYTGTNYTGDDDADGLSNGDEARWGSNALNPDSDGDGFKDGDEVAHNHHPSFATPNDKLPVNFDPSTRPQV